MADIEKIDISTAGKRSDDSVRPCPFCGSENIAVGSDKGTVYRRNTAFGDLARSVPTVRWAYCVDCGCVAPAEKVNNFDGFYKPDEQEDALNRAISTWNRRAQPANDPLTMEELREMYDEPVWVVCGIYADWRIPEFIDEGGYKGFIKLRIDQQSRYQITAKRG